MWKHNVNIGYAHIIIQQMGKDKWGMRNEKWEMINGEWEMIIVQMIPGDIQTHESGETQWTLNDKQGNEK